MRLLHPWKVIKVFVMLWLLASCSKTSAQRINADTCASVERLLEIPRPDSEKATLEAVKAACDAEKALRDSSDAGSK